MNRRPSILFLTLYDMICLGVRQLSSVARSCNVDTHIVIFKDQTHKPTIKDNKNYPIYQFYYDGIKHGSCYVASSYTRKEIKILVNLINDICPDVICLSTRSFGYEASKEIFAAISRSQAAHTPVIAGGWGPTLEPEKFLEFSDYVCFGEGEKTIKILCEKLKSGERNFASLPNIIYFNKDQLIHNQVSPPLDDNELDSLPFPDFDENNKYLIEKERIIFPKEFYNKNLYNCFIGRGCPLNCTYCLSSKYSLLYADHGHKLRKYRVRKVETVIQELERAKKTGVKFIRFADEIFPIYRDWLEKFIPLYRRHINLPFFAYIRPEFHDVDIIKDLHEIGLVSSVVGIQSGAKEIRRSVFKRYLSKHRIVSFAKTLNELDIDVVYHLINHNPFEQISHLDETFALLTELPYAKASVFKLVAFPQTPLARMLEEKKPSPLPEHIYRWYDYLYCLVVRGPWSRKLAKLVHRQQILQKHPSLLALLFIPAFAKLQFLKLARKIIYGKATMLQLPVRRGKRQQDAGPGTRIAHHRKPING